jgi:hypothetical protein
MKRMAIALALSACTSTGQLTPQAASDLRTAEADVLEALPIACDIAVALDPSQTTVICAVVDLADNLLTPPAVIKTASPVAAGAMLSAHPATPAVKAKLATVAAVRAGSRYAQ